MSLPPSSHQDHHDGDGHDDGSIEDYMQQLLQRVGNDSGGVKAGSTLASIRPAAGTTKTPDFVHETVPVEPPKPIRTPSRPPLQLDSLTKMRELANESSRSAISRHAVSSSRANAFSNLCFSGIAALAAAIFFVLSEGTSMFWMLPGLLATGASLYFCFQGVKAGKIAKQGVKSNKAQQDLSETETAANAAAAIAAPGFLTHSMPAIDPQMHQAAVNTAAAPQLVNPATQGMQPASEPIALDRQASYPPQGTDAQTTAYGQVPTGQFPSTPNPFEQPAYDQVPYDPATYGQPNVDPTTASGQQQPTSPAAPLLPNTGLDPSQLAYGSQQPGTTPVVDPSCYTQPYPQPGIDPQQTPPQGYQG